MSSTMVQIVTKNNTLDGPWEAPQLDPLGLFDSRPGHKLPHPGGGFNRGSEKWLSPQGFDVVDSLWFNQCWLWSSQNHPRKEKTKEERPLCATRSPNCRLQSWFNRHPGKRQGRWDHQLLKMERSVVNILLTSIDTLSTQLRFKMLQYL